MCNIDCKPAILDQSNHRSSTTPPTRDVLPLSLLFPFLDALQVRLMA